MTTSFLISRLLVNIGVIVLTQCVRTYFSRRQSPKATQASLPPPTADRDIHPLPSNVPKKAVLQVTLSANGKHELMWETELTPAAFATWQVIWAAEQTMWETFRTHNAELPFIVQKAMKTWEAAKQVAKANCVEYREALEAFWNSKGDQSAMGLCWMAYDCSVKVEGSKQAAREAEANFWSICKQSTTALPLPVQQAWKTREEAWATTQSFQDVSLSQT